MQNKSSLVAESFEERDGCYFQNDMQLTNFILQAEKIIIPNDNLILYQITVIKHEEKYIITVTATQLLRQRFLQELPILITDEAKFYKEIRKAILDKRFTEHEILYQTGRNGFQKINDKLMYVYTNGSLDKNGFQPKVYSGIDGAYFPEHAVLDLKEVKKTIHDLFTVYNCNPEIFYALFLLVLMSISNAYFRTIGEANFMKTTLWLDGASGSGKTELAKAAGNYTFSDENLNRELISVTCRRSYAIRRLGESSGIVCVLDDVKSERVQERKNSVKNIIDDFIRSIAQGRLTDSGGKNLKPEWIDSCVIVTGEYFETNESQNARMLYLKVGGFLKDEKNSNALRKLQENPLWLTIVCGGYIKWFLNKIEESSFSALIKSRLKEKRNSGKMYQDINNAERLNENRHMLEMAAILAEMYFEEIDMSESFISHFNKNVNQCINNICDDTFYLLGGETMVILKIMGKIFSKYNVRKARYETDSSYYPKYKYCQAYFWISGDDDFVWIDDYRDSMVKNNQSDHDKYNESPYLIIRECRFMELFNTELKNLLREKEISSLIADKVQHNSLKLLRKMQIIYKQHRSDSAWGRPAVDYPVYKSFTGCTAHNIWGNDDTYDSDDTKTTFYVDVEPVIQINTLHTCISALNERMESKDYESDYIENIKSVRIEQMKEDDIYKARQAFISGKSLYRE